MKFIHYKYIYVLYKEILNFYYLLFKSYIFFIFIINKNNKKIFFIKDSTKKIYYVEIRYNIYASQRINFNYTMQLRFRNYLMCLGFRLLTTKIL